MNVHVSGCLVFDFINEKSEPQLARQRKKKTKVFIPYDKYTNAPICLFVLSV